MVWCNVRRQREREIKGNGGFLSSQKAHREPFEYRIWHPTKGTTSLGRGQGRHHDWPVGPAGCHAFVRPCLVETFICQGSHELARDIVQAQRS